MASDGPTKDDRRATGFPGSESPEENDGELDTRIRSGTDDGVVDTRLRSHAEGEGDLDTRLRLDAEPGAAVGTRVKAAAPSLFMSEAPAANPLAPTTAEDDHHDTQPGVILENRFELRRLLARGGMGAVYVGFDRRFEVEVAVKLLSVPDQGARIEELERRFEAEAKVLARLKDPRVLKPLSWGRAPTGQLFLVSELLHGETLADRIKRRGRMSPVETARVLIDVCRGLSEAHAVGVVHRDIKPANLFLQKYEGGEEITRILDFGVAKISTADAPMTTPGLVVGTLAYMSPEQAQGEEVGPASDLYAVGVVAYECLSGERPFTGPATKVLMDHVATPAPSLDFERLGIQPEMVEVVETLLAKDPADRPTSASEVAQVFEAVAASASLAPRFHSPRVPTPPVETAPSAEAAPGETVDDRSIGSSPLRPPPPKVSPITKVAFGLGGAAAFLAGFIVVVSQTGEPTVAALEVKPRPDTGKEDPTSPPKPPPPPQERDRAESPQPEGSTQRDSDRAAADTRSAAMGPKEAAPGEVRAETKPRPKPEPPPSPARPRKKRPRVAATITARVGLSEGPDNRTALESITEKVKDCGQAHMRPVDNAEVAVVIQPGGKLKVEAKGPTGLAKTRLNRCVEQAVRRIALGIAGRMGVVRFQVERK